MKKAMFTLMMSVTILTTSLLSAMGTPIYSDTPEIEVVKFTVNYHLGTQDTNPFELKNFSVPETTHRWTTGNECFLSIPINSGKRGLSHVKFKVNALATEEQPQTLEVFLNDNNIIPLRTFTQGADSELLDIDIPVTINDNANFRFVIANACLPGKIYPGNQDGRILGFAFSEVELTYNNLRTLKVFSPKDTLLMQEGAQIAHKCFSCKTDLIIDAMAGKSWFFYLPNEINSYCISRIPLHSMLMLSSTSKAMRTNTSFIWDAMAKVVGLQLDPSVCKRDQIQDYSKPFCDNTKNYTMTIERLLSLMPDLVDPREGEFSIKIGNENFQMLYNKTGPSSLSLTNLNPQAYVTFDTVIGVGSFMRDRRCNKYAFSDTFKTTFWICDNPYFNKEIKDFSSQHVVTKVKDHIGAGYFTFKIKKALSSSTAMK